MLNQPFIRLTRMMAFRTILVRVLVIALAWSVALSPVGISESHDPAALATAEAERHAELAVELAEHGHTHDDGYGDEGRADHAHGHDPADHSHQTPAVTPEMALRLVAPAQDWQAWRGNPARELARTRLERPPRVPSLA